MVKPSFTGFVPFSTVLSNLVVYFSDPMAFSATYHWECRLSLTHLVEANVSPFTKDKPESVQVFSHSLLTVIYFKFD